MEYGCCYPYSRLNPSPAPASELFGAPAWDSAGESRKDPAVGVGAGVDAVGRVGHDDDGNGGALAAAGDFRDCGKDIAQIHDKMLLVEAADAGLTMTVDTPAGGTATPFCPIHYKH